MATETSEQAAAAARGRDASFTTISGEPIAPLYGPGDVTGEFDAKLGQRIAELKSELLKWMFLFWATTGLALGGLFFRK